MNCAGIEDFQATPDTPPDLNHHVLTLPPSAVSQIPDLASLSQSVSLWL